MKRYREQAKIAMALALTASSLASSIPSMHAQEEASMQENNFEKRDASLESKDRTEETLSTTDTQIKNELDSSSVDKTGEDIILNEHYFPDPVLREYIKNEYAINDNDILTEEMRSQLRTIRVNGLPNNIRSDLKSLEGIQYFPNLEILCCYHQTEFTGVLDVSANTNLIVLYTENTKITGLNIDGLTRLIDADLFNNPNLVGELDFSANSKLQTLRAYNTKISGLNLNGLENLLQVLIQNNPNLVGEFDFTSSIGLENIDMSNTEISSVNVKGLHNLTRLNIDNTRIANLDVSTNTSLQTLNCLSDLAWLNIGDNPNLTTVSKKDSIIDLGQVGYKFNIATVGEAFEGIDPSKVTMVSGATYDPTTGEVSGYQTGTPIVYRYDCGTMKNGQSVSLTVTLNFTIGLSESTIHINNYEGKEYDGTPVSNPTDIVKEGSNGEITFEWFRKTEDGQWESLANQAPVDAGEYGVKAHLAADADYDAADSGEPTPFEITKATSSISIDSYEGKEWDGTPVSDPTDITRTQNTATVTFKYYRADDMTEITAPSEVGAYKVKAFLSGDANYADSESDFVDFNIAALGTTITLTYENQVYTGNPVEEPQKDVHYTVEGSTGAVTIEWYEANDLTTPLAEAPTNVGSYVVKVSVAGTDTHTSASKTVSFEITPVASTISIDNYEGKEYDGTAVSNPVDITTTGSDGAVTFEWFVKTEDGNWESLGEQAPVNAGNYGVKAHLAANQNYTAADSGEPTPFEITKATSTIEILDDLNKTYDKEAVKEPTIKVEGTSETATISWFKKEDDGVTRAITWTPLTSAPVNAGDYKVVVTVAENNNSFGTTAEQEFTIAKANTNVSIEGTLDKEYDEVEVEVPNIKVEGSSGATTMEWYKKDTNGVWELIPGAAKEVGEYKITVKVEEDENYLSGEVEQTFTISEKVEVPSTPEAGEDTTITEEEKVEGVQTGDASQTSMWTMLAGLSMSMMYFFRRKKTK